MSEWRCLRLRVRGREDCVISAFHEDLDVLQAWMRRLGLPYYGQRLAGAASEVFLHLLKACRDPPGSRQALLAEQDHQCKLCAAPITATTCELDHIVPVHQSFAAQAQNLQALCLECHRNKTALESSHATTLESRFSRRAYEQYVESPRLLGCISVAGALLGQLVFWRMLWCCYRTKTPKETYQKTSWGLGQGASWASSLICVAVKKEEKH